jgi:hypothetical protein
MLNCSGALVETECRTEGLPMGIGDESSVVGGRDVESRAFVLSLAGGARGSLSDGLGTGTVFFSEITFFLRAHLLTGADWPFQMTPQKHGRDVDWVCGKRRHALG